MAPAFRYRYVDFGTVFTGDPAMRDAESRTESPGTLFSNELALDVGGTCWGSNEPLPVLDHHFCREAQFPSSAAAVLHKAPAIRGRFGSQRDGVLWLVTRKHPDFDALCAMYLARWIVEDPHAQLDWQPYGLHPDGWLDVADKPRIDWFNPDLGHARPEDRWPLLLASYASILAGRRHLSVARQRALHSILYAALRRGRDYLNDTSGATEFFDEVRAALVEKQLNPVFDSVLEGSARLAPELAMLDGEAQAYERDLGRARQAIVYLPEAEAPSADFFKSPKEVARRQLQGAAAEVDEENLRLADTFRIATDGIYLRDPECALFTEWARLDVENSVLGAGFEFTAVAYSQGRPEAVANQSRYVFAIDQERARGRHLYTVWSRLQAAEVEALRARPPEAAAAGSRAATLNTLLADPWFGGQECLGTLVRAPHRGTLIAPAGRRSDLRDDPVAEAVRTELEGSLYSAKSLVAGPQIAVMDFAASSNPGGNVVQQQFAFNAPQQVPPPRKHYFRFATMGLRSDVPIRADDDGRILARQIAETLWQVLYPESPGAVPADFVERHLVLAADSVGVWGDRGMAIAAKHNSPAEASGATQLREDFAALIALATDVERLNAEWSLLDPSTSADTGPAQTAGAPAFTTIAVRCEELAQRFLQLKRELLLPERELLRRFYEAIGMEGLLAALRDVNAAAAEHLRQLQVAEQARQMDARAGLMARMQSRLEWLEVFVVAFLVIEIIELITRYVALSRIVTDALVLLGGPAFALIAAWILKPWRHKRRETGNAIDRASWFLIMVIVACVAAWLVGLLRLWGR